VALAVVFYILAAVTLLGGLGVVVTRNVVYGALFLLTSLMGVAGLFVLLYAEFLALVQVLIYGGAIIIVILFALMLTRTSDYAAATEHRRWPFAAAAAVGVFALMSAAAIGDSAKYNQGGREGIGLVELGTGLFEQWAVPFEVASVLLLVALIGAIVIGRSNDGEESGK
jgi:NADH-quinone oxidoreductase subunit J